MAVYTHVSKDQLDAFLARYDIGTALSLEGIAGGVENTNYFLNTDRSKYILTLYEKRVNPEDLPFFLNLMKHMARKGLPAACPVAAKDRTVLQKLCERAAAIIEFVPGTSHLEPLSIHCRHMGGMLAKAHLAVHDFKGTRQNDLSLSGWQRLSQACLTQADECNKGLANLIRDELTYLEENWPDDKSANLPRGVIHADFFPDNVLFDAEGKISGLIDFYFSCTDYFVYDIAICINAWCFDSEHTLCPDKLNQFLEAYNKERKLTDEELEALPLMLRGNSLRFLLTRLYDWLNRVDGAIVNVKDPLEYEKKLRFHQTNPINLSFKKELMLKIYTDGACSGNPGPGGWGVFMMDGENIRELKGGEETTTNNRMELMAAIEAMRATQAGSKFQLYTDSTYVKNGLNEWIYKWKKNGWKTASKKPVKNKDLWIELDELAASRSVEWHWVKGHAGDPGNERADELAREGLQEYGKGF